jgi:transposase
MTPQLLDVRPSKRRCAVPKPVCGGKRFVELPSREQVRFETRCLDDIVPPEAFVRMLDAILDALDFGAFEAEHPGGGRPAYPPRLLCKLLLFGQCVSVRSAREISRRIERDTHFRWLAHEVAVDHETLSEFRRDHSKQLRQVFKQVARIGVTLGLARMEHVSLDGTKLAAHAGRQAHDQKSLEAALKRIDERIDKLMDEAEALDAAEDQEFGRSRGDQIPQELQQAEARREKIQEALVALSQSEHDHIALNDFDATLQKTQDGKRPGYNGQLAVDAEVGYVLAEQLVTDQNDTAQFLPMAQQVVENAGQAPEEFAADSGYHSPETLEALAAREAEATPEAPALNAYINQRREEKRGRFAHDAFAYDAATDTYTCLEGKTLKYRGTRRLREITYRRFRAACSCADCPRRAECITEKVRYRELLVSPHDPLLRAMREKLATPKGEGALQLRKQTVERTFGTMKAQLGLRQFQLRGLEGAQAEFTLCATAVNVRKLAKWLQDGGSLEQLKEAAAKAALSSRALSALQGLRTAFRSLTAKHRPTANQARPRTRPAIRTAPSRAYARS